MNFLLHNVGGMCLRAIGELKPCPIDDTIAIAGVPRSGTTWLLELLRSIPEYKALREPLHRDLAFRKYGFEWRTYVEPDASGSQHRSYLEKVLSGRVGIPGWHFEASSRAGQLVEHATRNRLIVKFCRLNRMLVWFERQFTTRGTIFVIRHPCAVVSSMINHGLWDEELLHGKTRREQALHGAELPPALEDTFGPVLNRISTKTEVLATMWCLDHYIPFFLHSKGNYPWTLVPYERLVAFGQEELQRLTNALDIQVHSQMRNQLDAPSSSVKGELHQDAQKQLSKWRRQLSPKQIRDVLRIVDDVGLTKFYTDDLEPDYDALNQYQQPKYAWQ